NNNGYFYGCANLVLNAIDKLKANNMTTFRSGFRECSDLTAISAGLFDNNPAITNFNACFSDCSLTAIPAGLFDNNILVTDFGYCFNKNYLLTAIPSGLFDYNTVIIDIDGCFSDCSDLTAIPAGLFDNNTLVTDFRFCFYNGSALTGSAPELWLRDPEPTGTQCFYNATGLDNYGDIPGDWK
ncbi:unnamed protein product, partial [marine sediment metagenome]